MQDRSGRERSTTTHIAKDVARRVRIMAVERDETVQHIVTQALLRYLPILEAEVDSWSAEMLEEQRRDQNEP